MIIDDDRDMCMLLNRFLSGKGYDTVVMHKGTDALKWLSNNKADLVLCDYKLDDITGTELLPQIKQTGSNVPVIMITAYSDVKSAVTAMKNGAYDYIIKPLLPDEILVTIQKTLASTGGNNDDAPAQKTAAKGGNAMPAQGTSKSNAPKTSQYVESNSPAIAKVLEQIELVAPTNYSVIIYGESGSGKEAIAQQIHRKSNRADKMFVAIDCGALSKELAASELFGHEKGSFTGALFQKIGSFEVANGGTIFLDEIANLSYDIQVSLLRVIQERSIKRLGGTKDIPLDIRIIIASNEPLWKATKEGKFREDLYHRFNEFNINVPPLRERREDIMFFANHFLKLTNEELGKHVKGFTPDAEAVLNEYTWHGNLRELKNVIKRATLLSEGNLIETKSLPFEIVNHKRLAFDTTDDNGSATENGGNGEATQQAASTSTNRLKDASADTEYEIILGVLKETNYNKTKAAQKLNIDRKTLYNKLNQYKLNKQK